MSIELTDEQLDNAHDMCEFEHEEFGSQVSNLDDVLETFASSLTTSQLQELCEQHGGSFMRGYANQLREQSKNA